MSYAIGATSPVSIDPSGRRLAWGLLLSVLFHLLVLSLQFGIPGIRAGSGSPPPLTVRLAPPAPVDPVSSVPVPAPLPAIGTLQPIPEVLPVPPVAVQPSTPEPSRRGFALRDPVVPAPPPVPATVAKPVRRTPRRRARPGPGNTADGMHADVIARESHVDSEFKVPLTSIEQSAGTTTAEQEKPETPPMPAVAESSASSDAGQREAERVARQAAEEAARQEAERQRLQALQQADEEARLRAQREAVQRRQDEEARLRLAEQDRMQQVEQERANAERERAAELRRQQELARQQLAEQQRVQQVAEQRRQEELARQQLLEQQRAQQVAEQRRQEELVRQQLAEQRGAQQVAEQRRQEELVREQLAEQRRAQQVAEQRRQEELAQRELAERQRAAEDARQARDAILAGRGAPSAPHAGGDGSMPGAGQGDGGLARGGKGMDLGSRAHDMLRGIDVGKAVPEALRPANEVQQGGRRALAEAVRREVPLRLYADSVRQKIERNAVLSERQLRGEGMAGDPVVSVAIRSDGSVENVAIVRSSGRPDIDDLVRRIVRVNAHYSAFPPNVAANYDVIELRRVWRFAGILRLLEETP